MRKQSDPQSLRCGHTRLLGDGDWCKECLTAGVLFFCGDCRTACGKEPGLFRGCRCGDTRNVTQGLPPPQEES